MNGDDMDSTLAESHLPDAAFHATITMVSTINKFRVGQKEMLDVILRNTSSAVWPALPRHDGRFQVHLGNHWLDENGKTFMADDGRSGLPFDIKPGKEVKMKLTVTPPSNPGDYILEIDVVQESVAWFAQKGSKTLRIKVRVE
jgi:hypothetical protein